jgi:hypothetical protein
MNQRLIAGLNGFHALLLGAFSLSAMVLSVGSLLEVEGSLDWALFSSAFRSGLFCVAGLAFAAYQLRWSRRLWRGELATAAGFAIAGVMLLVNGYFSLSYAALATVSRLFMSFDVLGALSPLPSPILTALFTIVPRLIALATIALLSRSLTRGVRLASLLGAFAAALGLEALLTVLSTAPALLSSGAALGLEAQLTYTPPVLATFAANAAFAPFGVNGSGGELWPIALIVALALPVALLVLHASRRLLGGTLLAPRSARLLGLLVIVASLAPFSGDRLSLALPELITRSTLIGLVFGLALLLSSLRRRAVTVPLAVFGIAAVLMQAIAYLTRLTPAGPGELLNELLNGIAAHLKPEELPSLSLTLIFFAVQVGLLVRAGILDNRDAPAA